MEISGNQRKPAGATQTRWKPAEISEIRSAPVKFSRNLRESVATRGNQRTPAETYAPWWESDETRGDPWTPPDTSSTSRKQRKPLGLNGNQQFRMIPVDFLWLAFASTDFYRFLLISSDPHQRGPPKKHWKSLEFSGNQRGPLKVSENQRKSVKPNRHQ